MEAARARALAQQWLQEEWLAVRGHAEGARGAFIMGSLAALGDGDQFDGAASDIDICIVVDPDVLAIDRAAYPDGKFELYRGCIVQSNLISHEVLQREETLLTMLGLGCNLRHGRILLDHDDTLAEARAVVLARWHEPSWRTRRSERAITFAEEKLADLGRATSPIEQLGGLGSAVMHLAGLIAIGTGVTPTHRRALPVARAILTDADRGDLMPRLLGAIGADGADVASVAAATDDVLEALQLESRSAGPAHADSELLSVMADFVRRGIDTIVAEGFPGDAMLPALDGLIVSATVAGSVAEPEDRRRLDELVARALERAGMPPQPWADRRRVVDELASDVIAFCREAAGR